MSRALITLNGPTDRFRAIALIEKAQRGTRVLFKAAKRSIAQNDLMWGLLTDIARQVDWHGQKLTAEDWKFVMLDALKRELRIVPNIDGTGFVNLGRSSSDLSKSEMSDLIELIRAFGANHSVTFFDEPDQAALPGAA